ncbi:MAG: cob(I)alamin adenosyltransferase [Paracoccaceae bacterium]
MAAALEHGMDTSVRIEGNCLMVKKPTTTEELARANEKSKKRKESRDRMLADKTVEKGLLIVHTGKGKGKSTAAFGLVARAIGNDMKIGVVQYVKGKWETGERLVLDHFPDQVTIRTMGEGFTWETQDKARDIAAAEAAWAVSKEMIADPSYDLVVLDELNIVLRYDYLDIEDVLETFRKKRDMLHVVVTGRNAKPELVEIADLVTEMTQIKHPFREQNVRAQKGIEF